MGFDRGVVQERMRSGKSFEVRVAYTVPGGGEQEAVLSENGPARHPGERVTVRYDLREGRVVDAALADNDEAFWVGGGILAFLAFGTLVMNVIAWLPAPRTENGTKRSPPAPTPGGLRFVHPPRVLLPKQHPRSR
ncbi:hypothetical protein ACFQV2_23575 [Actinokineospora soli]|uniref:DUF3592 domain-containing protein n=1 Tax=Actinokineospora soli TaxID=1048753 RepID=A0ABW2TQP6_9PSEU